MDFQEWWEEKWAQMRKDFSPEAIKHDNGRYTITAAFVVERLNEVFGPMGVGWCMNYAKPSKGDKEIYVQGALQFRLPGSDIDGYKQAHWDNVSESWVCEEGGPWSAPIYAWGGNQLTNFGGTPISDTTKSAHTNAISKAASKLGVGDTIYKGMYKQQKQAPQNSFDIKHFVQGVKSLNALDESSEWSEASEFLSGPLTDLLNIANIDKKEIAGGKLGEEITGKDNWDNYTVGDIKKIWRYLVNRWLI